MSRRYSIILFWNNDTRAAGCIAWQFLEMFKEQPTDPAQALECAGTRLI